MEFSAGPSRNAHDPRPRKYPVGSNIRSATVPTPGLEIGSPVAVYGAWGCGQCSNCRKGAGELLPQHFCQLGRASIDGGMADTSLYLPSLPRSARRYDASRSSSAHRRWPYAVSRDQAGPSAALVPGSFVVVIGAGGLGHLARAVP